MSRILALIASVFALCFNVTDATETGENMEKVKSKGYAMFSKDGPFKPYEFERHAVGDNDILIKIMYVGICHSDIHQARSEWNEKEHYPMVPGHEIVGQVVQIGKNVTKFNVGDYAGVGCMVNSCKDPNCETCHHNREQECCDVVFTYASKDKFHGGEITQGGYSNNIVISEEFAIKVPADAGFEKIAPLLCAGITTYSPIQFSKVRKGDKVAVAGFGGLGHMAVQYLVRIGAEVTVFDVSEEKREVAMKMGAKEFVDVSKSPNFYKDHLNEFYFILSTIPAKYDMSAYLRMLKFGGEFAIVGLPATQNLPSISLNSFVFTPNRKIYGSLIGGIKETQEMLDFSVENDIYPQVKIIRGTPDKVAKQITEAYNTIVDGKVQFRFVIDMRNL